MAKLTFLHMQATTYGDTHMFDRLMFLVCSACWALLFIQMLYFGYRVFTVFH